MDIDQRKGIVVFILMLMVGFLIGYNGIYKSNQSRIHSLKLQIEDEKKKNELLLLTSILDKRLEAYERRCFSTAEVTPLLDKIFALAKEADIEIETFNPLSLIRGEEYVEIPVEIPFSCSYHKLGQFLSLIESNQEFIWVKKLQMQKSTVMQQEAGKNPKIKLTLSGIFLEK